MWQCTIYTPYHHTNLIQKESGIPVMLTQAVKNIVKRNFGTKFLFKFYYLTTLSSLPGAFIQTKHFIKISKSLKRKYYYHLEKFIITTL